MSQSTTHGMLRRFAAATVLLVSLAAVGGAGFVYLHRAEAQARADQAIHLAMGQAQALRDLALTAGDTVPPQRGLALWAGALAAADRVEQALEDDATGSETRQAAEQLVAELREQAQSAADDREMLRRVEEAHQRTLLLQDSDYLRPHTRGIVWGDAAPLYARTFKEHGIDVDALSVEEVAQRIGERRIKQSLLATLDFWASCETGAARGKLLDIACRIDTEPLRNQVRAALAHNGGAAVLKQLSVSESFSELPTSTVLLLARELYDGGLGGQALALVVRARQRHPNDFWLQTHAGIYLMHTAPPDYAEAIRAHAAATALRPTNEIAWSNLGAVLLADGQAEAAGRALRRSLELVPDSTTCHQRLVEALMLHRGGHDALAAAAAGLRRCNDSPMLQTARAAALRALHRDDEACAALEQALAKEPRWYFAAVQLVEVYADQGDKQKALALLDEAQRMHPGVPSVLLARCKLLYRLQDYDGACTAGEAAVRADPSSRDAIHALALALAANRQYAAAVREYGTAASLAPRDARAAYELGSALLRQEQHKPALTAMEAAVHWHPNQAPFHLAVGMNLFRQQRYGEAIVAFQKSVALAPDVGENRSWLALAYYRAGDVRAAEEAIGAGPPDKRSGFAHKVLGDILLSQDRCPEALKHFDMARRATPEDGALERSYGRCLLRMGKFTEAQQALTKGLDLAHASADRSAVQNDLKECERALALDKQLDVFRINGELPKLAKGILELADLARRYKQHYNLAATLYSRVFTPEAQLIDEVIGDHRYRAACSALLTVMGKAVDLPRPSGSQQTGRREQALAWLRAELDHCTKASLAGKSEDTPRLIERIARWKTASELAMLRDPKTLEKLSGDEQLAWRELWDDAELFVKVARVGVLQVSLHGNLTPAARSQAYEVRLIGGKAYAFDLESTGFAPVLRIYDPDGKPLAEDEDVRPDNRNARIAFTAGVDGTYRVVAASARAAGTGPFALRIAALKEVK
jgi:tetratricopeptide (TPR) repeat protein